MSKVICTARPLGIPQVLIFGVSPAPSARLVPLHRWGVAAGQGATINRRPSVGMIVVLAILGGVVLGIGTTPLSAPGESAAETATVAMAPIASMGSSELKYDPATAVYEPFIACSADYASGPGAALDRSDQIGPENSVMVSPEQLRAMGLPESEVTAQAHAWHELSPEMREEQLCRASQENAAVGEPR